MRGPAMLSVESLSKTFPGTRALDGVSLEVAAGEIHSLVGANGSGKSTLIKALAGVQPADAGGWIQAGSTRLDAATITPDAARAAGVLAVHQEPAIFPELTVAENLALGSRHGASRWGRWRWRHVDRHARAVIEQFELDTEPDALAGDLRPALRSMLGIARILSSVEGGGGILVLDEPTALLPLHDVELLHGHLRRQAAAGRAILHVSHRLDEVIALSHRVTVLRDGRRIGTYGREDCSEDQLADAMFGATKAPEGRPAVARSAAPVLAVRGLAGGPVRGVDLEVHPGEVVGLVGLAGSGAAEVGRLLFGAEPRTAGAIEVDGAAVRADSPARARADGLGLILGDLSAAVFPDLSVADNFAMADLGSFSSRSWLSDRAVRRATRAAIEGFGVVTGGPDAPVATLSGGNQQKVVFARWLARRPRVLLLEDPTAGVDVAARTAIYALLGTALADGLGVLISSSDMEELAMVCDRVLLVRDGRVAAQLDGPGFTSTTISHLVYQGAAHASV